ncbi:MAG TPA: hypothetical protein VI386_09525 [Candidatus Sulfotelmatobacter sp.]
MNLPKPGALHIERKSLALDQLAVLRDRHVNAAAAFGIDQLMSWGIVSGYSPPAVQCFEAQGSHPCAGLGDAFPASSPQICE